MDSSVKNNSAPFEDYIKEVMVYTMPIGIIVFVENVVFLTILAKLVHQMRKKNDLNDIFVHFIFVCVNDTLSGFVIILLSIITVDSLKSARVCAFVMILSLSLNSMSQCNVAGICAQRFIGAKNIRKLSTGRQIRRTASLLAFNILVWMVSFGASALGLRISYNTPEPVFCSVNVIEGSLQYLVIFFIFGVVFTVTADVLCFLTIRKLKKDVDTTVVPSEFNNQINDKVRKTRTMQQKGIFTVFLILLFLNLSSIPSVITYSLTMLGVRPTAFHLRIVYVSFFLNSIVNPVVIATRTQDVRNALPKCIKFSPNSARA